MSQSWAVVTGASAGLGAAFVEELARQGSNVVLVARSADRLAEVARRAEALGVATRVVPADLSDASSRRDMMADLAHLEVHTLINNAGFGSLGPVAELDPDRLADEVELNVQSLTQLTRVVLPGMLERSRGAIVNVASTAAFQAIPRMATYAATKAYVLRFSIGLWGELRGSGVRVTAICPGPTDTAFFANAGDDAVMKQRRRPEQVVATTFAALKADRPYAVDGARNAVMAQATRFVPTAMAVRMAEWVATH